MKIDLYEKIWMWGVGAMLALFFTSTAWAAFRSSAHPPSHVETIDPEKLFADPRFAPQGVSIADDGSVHVRVIGLTFAWLPAEVAVPAETPITFHLTARDVVHGYQIVRSNGQAMVIPGYISQFTTQFHTPGEYLVVCNEYCGVGHHVMFGKLVVVPKDQWQAGQQSAPVADPTAEGGAHAGH